VAGLAPGAPPDGGLRLSDDYPPTPEAGTVAWLRVPPEHPGAEPPQRTDRAWHHRRLRVRPGGRRTSAAARLRAHLLALGAWMAAGGADVRLRPTAVVSPLMATVLRTRLAKRLGWAAAARRWA
jgi:hypothetical protein